KKIILYVSRIHPIKGIERLIESVNNLSRVKIQDYLFVIAGNGDEAYVKSLKMLIKSYDIESYFKFVGYVEKEEKMALIDRSSCFILPSYTESFSISIVEAMARNIPVVTTKGTPWQEINKYKCGYWVENNQKSIQKG